MGTRRLTLISVLLLALTAACATGTGGTPGPGTPGASGSAATPSGSPTSGPTPSEEVPLPPPTRTPKPAAGDVTVTGTIVDGVEAGCKLLQTGDHTYLLITQTERLPTGARVVVTGRVQPDLVTTCMQGTPLVVSSVKPA